jgi:arylsulfatase A-like enzyme
VNIVLVIIDTLRRDHVGAYGSERIQTPHLDAFAKESVRMTRAYPESLATLCVRRAMHTGLRTFPYRGHRDYKGDFSGAPGWGPIPEEQQTIAEALGGQGYACGLITDTYHMFKPSKNFHRGFHEWILIRGQEADRYRSGPPVPAQRLARHMTVPPSEDPAVAKYVEAYLRNNADRVSEPDYFPARVFGEASRWILGNRSAEKFFLVVDSFDPHEPWDPPVHYRRLYDPDDDVVDLIHSVYGPWEEKISARELRRVQANYAGELTMVDRWFGHFFETLRLAGRLADTVVAVMSDHGHNLGYDPQDKGLLSKQGHPMTHAVADLVMMVRHPSGEGAGSRCDALVYNHDLVATLLSLAGARTERALDGVNFWPAVQGREHPKREGVTIGWGPLITVITDEWWYNASIWGESPLLYRVPDDPKLEHNLANDRPSICNHLRDLAITDAGGEIPEAFKHYHNQPGCTPFEVRYRRGFGRAMKYVGE